MRLHLCLRYPMTLLIFFAPFLVGKILIQDPRLATTTLATATANLVALTHLPHHHSYLASPLLPLLPFELIIIPCLFHHHNFTKICATAIIIGMRLHLCLRYPMTLLIFFAPFLVGKILIHNPRLATTTLATATANLVAFDFSRSLFYLI